MCNTHHYLWLKQDSIFKLKHIEHKIKTLTECMVNTRFISWYRSSSYNVKFRMLVFQPTYQLALYDVFFLHSFPPCISTLAEYCNMWSSMHARPHVKINSNVKPTKTLICKCGKKLNYECLFKHGLFVLPINYIFNLYFIGWMLWVFHFVVQWILFLFLFHRMVFLTVTYFGS